MTDKDFECKDCGAVLKFAPGTSSLKCEYCGTVNQITPENPAKVEELDFKQYLSQSYAQQASYEVKTVKCGSCAAEFNLSEQIKSTVCPFCEASIINSRETTKKIIKPAFLLPFKVTQNKAQEHFRQWIKSLWFAPGKLKQYARSTDGLQGMYLPYWTYDTKTSSTYSGQRGTHYYVTETYTTTEDGKSVTKTRQVRKTRWHHVNGRVSNNFDDVLVVASHSLPRNYIEALEPWDLKNLVPYKDEYLSGFRTENYRIGLQEGFEEAKVIMASRIRETVKRDIGGDEQRISDVNTLYRDITFKHILLPVWLTSYHFQNRIFRIMINARTGEVQGERPWSKVKIALAVAVVLLVIIGIAYFYYSQKAA